MSSFIDDEAGVSMDASASPDEMDADGHDGYDDSFVDDEASTQHFSDEYFYFIRYSFFTHPLLIRYSSVALHDATPFLNSFIHLLVNC